MTLRLKKKKKSLSWMKMENQNQAAPYSEDATTAYLKSLPELKRYISRLLPHAARSGEIDDIAQEVFARAYAAKKKQKLENGRGFLFRIARNLSYNASTKRKKNVEQTVEDFVLEGVISNVPTVEDEVIHKQRLIALTDAMSQLPPKCREAFFLRHFEGVSHKGIAERMNIAASTVEKHLAKALLLTSRAMKQHDQMPAGVIVANDVDGARS